MLRVPAIRVVLALLGTVFAVQHAGGQAISTTMKVSTVACRTTPDIAEMERVSAVKDKAAWEKFIMPRLADKRCIVVDRGTSVFIDQRLVRPNGSPLACIRRAADADCWWVASERP
jgi:hypothetical protein